MSKHKETIQKIFEHPTSQNIEFKKVIHALEHYGASVKITKHNKAKIFLNKEELSPDNLS